MGEVIKIPVARGVLQTARKNFGREKFLYLMSAMGFVYIFIFNYIPIYGILVAFKNFNPVQGIWRSPWVGLHYFQLFFENPFLGRLVRNTVLLGLYSLLWGFWPPIVLALLFNELRNKLFKNVIQTITYFPNFIATVIIVGLMMELFSASGLVNNIRALLGASRPIYFFAQAEWFRTLYISSSIWQSLGAGTIIYLATLSGINPELYESAVIDGANRLRQIIHITIPSILPTMMILLIFASTGIVNVGFEKVYLMYSPAIYDTADVIATYTYRLGIQEGLVGYGSAVGLFNQLISLVFMVTANLISRKTTEYSLW